MAKIALSQIRPNVVALRAVSKDSEAFIGLVDSIRQRGVLNAISVRELPPEDGQPVYGLIDGLHRFTAAGEAGLTEIDATVVNMDDAEVEEAQIIANVHKIETKHYEYSKALQRLLSRNPTLTMLELATRLARTPSWLSQHLNLTKLDPTLGALVDEGKITLTNAFSLSKLPLEEQKDWIDRAITQPPQEFVPSVNSRLKEIKDAKKEGRAPSEGFKPVPHLQKLSAINEEKASRRVAAALCADASSPIDGFLLALDWVLHLDPLSIDEARAKYEARQAELAVAKEARAKERAAKKEKEAVELAASV